MPPEPASVAGLVLPLPVSPGVRVAHHLDRRGPRGRHPLHDPFLPPRLCFLLHDGALHAFLAVRVVDLHTRTGVVLVDQREGPVGPVPAPDRDAVLDVPLVLSHAPLLSLVPLLASDLVRRSPEDVRRAEAGQRRGRIGAAQGEVVVVRHVDMVEGAARRAIDHVELLVDLVAGRTAEGNCVVVVVVRKNE